MEIHSYTFDSLDPINKPDNCDFITVTFESENNGKVVEILNHGQINKLILDLENLLTEYYRIA